MEISVENLRVSFATATGPVEAVRGVSFRLGREKVGIVGESGSGKSLTARSILRLLPRQATLSANRLSFDGIDVVHADEQSMCAIRGKRGGFIMQDPKYSLNPVLSIGSQLAETWRVHRGGSRKAAREAALHLLDQVRIRHPMRVAGAYPHELSGGMGQRVMIAMMLAPDPEFLIADEPTSALDMSVQAEIMRLLDDLVVSKGMGLLLISHDLPLVAQFCDRVLVMYAGRIVEELRAGDLMNAQHPYTRGLLECLPSLSAPRTRLKTLERSASWLSQ